MRVGRASLLVAALAAATGCSSGSSSVRETHAVSGTVSGAVASGVTITLGGAAAATATTDGSGRYRFPSLRDGSYTVTPSLAGYAFTPPSRSVAVAGSDVEGQDFGARLPACAATSPASLVACGAAVQAGLTEVIEVEGPIVCSGPDACRLEISGASVTIRGHPGAYLHRIDHHDYPLIELDDTPSVVIEDLTIDEDATVPCTPLSPTNPPVSNPACAPSVDVYGFGDLTLDRVTIAASKSLAVAAFVGGSLTIRHSRLVGSDLFGLQTATVTGGLLVEDTVFADIKSNAMVVGEFHGTADAPLRIRRTLFDNNHHDDAFYVCGPQSHEQCGGGQLLLYDALDFLSVDDTVIRFTTPQPPPGAGGVEMNGSMHDIRFASCDIHGHGMWGAYVNPDPVDLARVSFIDDELYDNGSYPEYLGVDIGNFPDGIVTESGTCHSAGCRAVPFGGLWALPGGAVSWATNDLAEPRVTVDGALVSTSPDGRLTVGSGSLVVLLDGAAELDRVIAP
jgi:hypothetical protein